MKFQLQVIRQPNNKEVTGIGWWTLSKIRKQNGIDIAIEEINSFVDTIVNNYSDHTVQYISITEKQARTSIDFKFKYVHPIVVSENNLERYALYFVKESDTEKYYDVFRVFNSEKFLQDWISGKNVGL